MISYKWFLDPRRTIPVVFGIQWIMWFLFVPDRPTIPTAEPKHYEAASILLWMIYFSALTLGTWLGVGTPKPDKKAMGRYQYKGQTLYLFRLGVIALLISVASQLYRYRNVLDVKSVLAILQTAYGQNRLAAMIKTESPFGLASLSTLWILSSIIFALIYFDGGATDRLRRRARRYLWLTGAAVIFFSVFDMARLYFIHYCLILLGSNLLLRRSGVRARTLLTTVTITIAFIWVGSLIRTGIALAASRGVSLFSLEVQSYIFSELGEKYLGAELNHALIMMSYPADVFSNWPYGTMIARWFEPYSPPRYLNTINILGIWYWQFGLIGGLVISCIAGWALGRIYRNAILTPKGLSWPACYFLLSYPGLWGMTRINHFFLQSFVVPFIVLIIAKHARTFFIRPKVRMVRLYGKV